MATRKEIEAVKALDEGDASKLIALFITLSRDHRPVHPLIQELLAEMLDLHGKSEWRLKLVRRGRGKPVPPHVYRIRAIMGVLVWYEFKRNGKFEAAVKAVAARFNMSHGTVTAAYKEHLSWLKETKSN